MAAPLRVLHMLALVVATVTNVRFTSAALVTVTYPEPAGKPLSAQILGVDSQGYTTYAVQLPETDGTGSTLAVFTETLVAGADYVSVTISTADAAASATLIEGGECSLLGGDAVCYSTDEAGRAVTRTTPIASGGWGKQVLDVATGTSQPSNLVWRCWWALYRCVCICFYVA
ncbi:hypothetical protein GGX14DRAFT_440145 [Mycena pura]|uniref:Uncharacterized protein n=1 Tax=Mycena pura TaxID=153505 RepID=A0AAD6VMY6_9AGAR|nr:hypothetical protein GGX14DRAFT_440145 [Mycena pura]